jgi:hypothetical protein
VGMPIGSSHHFPKIGRFPLFLLVNPADRNDCVQTVLLYNPLRDGAQVAHRKFSPVFLFKFFPPSKLLAPIACCTNACASHPCFWESCLPNSSP